LEEAGKISGCKTSLPLWKEREKEGRLEKRVLPTFGSKSTSQSLIREALTLQAEARS
jgi:hypothetical protein